jgi:FkbM family methyltransferase
MKLLARVARRFQFLEWLLPAVTRVPARFLVQRALGGLEPEVQLLDRLIPHGGIAIDVGANRGTYVYALSKICDRVFAFEPIPECAAMLRAWAAGRNVEVHQCALGAQKGFATLNIPRAHGTLITTRASFVHRTSGEMSLQVEVTSIDDLALAHVDFIKVDVEGYELQVLVGAEATLRRCRPTILIEIDAASLSHAQFAGTFSWLEAHKYSGHYCDSGRLTPCDSSIAVAHTGMRNFVFLPARES